MRKGSKRLVVVLLKESSRFFGVKKRLIVLR